nr:MAG TPA: hypothetical protein [Caudoviricetes sp.]
MFNTFSKCCEYINTSHGGTIALKYLKYGHKK